MFPVIPLVIHTFCQEPGLRPPFFAKFSTFAPSFLRAQLPPALSMSIIEACEVVPTVTGFVFWLLSVRIEL